MSVQNTTEVFRKHLMAKKVRIKAWHETGDSAANMAVRLGREEAHKRVSSWPNCFYALGVTGIIKNEEDKP